MKNKTLQLIRLEKCPNGYFGYAWLGKHKFFSCEDLEAHVSPGKYRLEKHQGRKKDVFRLEDLSSASGSWTADGRTGVLIHIGNDETDSTGCILLGEDFNRDEADNLELRNSTKAIQSLWLLEPNFIEIRETPGSLKNNY